MSAHHERPRRRRVAGWVGDPLGDRSGREPVSARSSLSLRLVLSLAGTAGFVALAVLLLLAYGSGWLPVVALVLAVVGVVDALVIVIRLRR